MSVQSLQEEKNRLRHAEAAQENWTVLEAATLLRLPLMELLFKAQSIHRTHFNPNQVQLSTLLNIKSGGCPEDCGYCPQSARFETDVQASGLLDVATVAKAALAAREAGATRFCMGAAWRAPKDKDLDQVIPLIQAVKNLGMETCVTLGMLRPAHAVAIGRESRSRDIEKTPRAFGPVLEGPVHPVGGLGFVEHEFRVGKDRGAGGVDEAAEMVLVHVSHVNRGDLRGRDAAGRERVGQLAEFLRHEGARARVDQGVARAKLQQVAKDRHGQRVGGRAFQQLFGLGAVAGIGNFSERRRQRPVEERRDLDVADFQCRARFVPHRNPPSGHDARAAMMAREEPG